MTDWAQLKADDAAAGSNPDLTQGVAVLRQLTVDTIVPVGAVDIRTVLWATFEYGVLEQLLDEGKAGSFENYPSGTTAAEQRSLLIALRTTFSFLNSGTTVSSADEVHWQAIVAQLGQLVTFGLLQAGTHDQIAASRTVKAPKYPGLDEGMLQTGRAQP